MNTEQNIQLNINIGFKAIRLIGFQMTEAGKMLKESLAPNLYEFQVTTSYSVNPNEKLLDVNLIVKIFHKKSINQTIELAELITLTSFFIDNFEEVISRNENEFNIPDQLVAMVAGISVSTTRGIIFMATADTVLSNAILPIIKPTTFIPPKTI